MINVQKKRITAAQIGILVWMFGLVLGVGLFFQFVQRPLISRTSDVREQVDLLENHVKWVTQTIERLQDPGKVLDYFVNESRELSRKFPATEQKSLAMIADYAHKFGVHVEQIQAGPQRRVLNHRGERMGAGGKTCYGVPVSLKFKCEYTNWIKYIETLHKVLPAYLVVRNVTIENGLSSMKRLEGKLDMTLYLLE